MSTSKSVALSDDEIDLLLDTGGVGVISFADDNEPYSVPISYGYDKDVGDLYVRLAFAPESEKRRFVDDGVRASLVVTDDEGGKWRSVVARGRLTEISEPAVAGTAAQSIHQIDIPYVTIYDRRAGELEFELYRLDPESITGRKEA
ncbi:pyridoxamine 5'-phosphate oxidase family protein [Halonotius terrestris]|uniref:Pyridoxamine 5'-phosphate oxidase family protein n=1 Tax=Halonotius terrestris TaxID=2487750 RepID=A0A8J8PBN1_9EURY|nr:pyridoxamine 5'-phosphate oxidase family protein [Halonotius terrestris]TQQ80878.1 pyridoxamine 5'-phosphate oxidase family protein [Halonotius terrestris]